MRQNPNDTTSIIENNLFYCHHLSDADKHDISLFSVKKDGLGLEAYLKQRALCDERSGQAKTYIVRSKFTDEIVGYFSLQAGLVAVNERYVAFSRTFDSESGVELSNFAINQAYINKHPDNKGCGIIIFNDFVLPIIDKASAHIGIKILYLYALPKNDLIERYKKYGFSRLNKHQEKSLHRRLRPYYDKGCIFMFVKI